jgi:hypothetical protein
METVSARKWKRSLLKLGEHQSISDSPALLQHEPDMATSDRSGTR